MGDNNNNGGDAAAGGGDVDGPHLIEDDDTSETVAFKVRAAENLYARKEDDNEDHECNSFSLRAEKRVPRKKILATKAMRFGRPTGLPNLSAPADDDDDSSSFPVMRKRPPRKQPPRKQLATKAARFGRIGPNVASGKESGPTGPNVASGKEFMFLLKKSQPFLKVFLHYQKKHGLKKEDIELQFGNMLLSEEDTPASIQLQPNDVVVVRACRNPDIVFKVKAEEDLFSSKTKSKMATDPNNASSKPKVKVGTEIVMCLRNTQRFSSYLFNIFHKDLRREDLEFRFGLNFIKEDDTPNRIGLQTNDTIWVRKCRNPSSKKQSSNIMFEVKVAEDLYSDGKKTPSELATLSDLKIKPDVKKGKNYFFLLRRGQKLHKVFQTFMSLNENLDDETCQLEFRYKGRVLTNSDTPNAILLEQNDVIWVQNGEKKKIPPKKKAPPTATSSAKPRSGSRSSSPRRTRATAAAARAKRKQPPSLAAYPEASARAAKRRRPPPPPVATTTTTRATRSSAAAAACSHSAASSSPTRSRYNLRNRRSDESDKQLDDTKTLTRKRRRGG